MGRYTAAAEQFDEAYSLYASTVGRHSPLFGGAAEGKAKALQKAERYEEAFEATDDSTFFSGGFGML